MPSPLHGQVSLSSTPTQLSGSATSVNSFVVKAPATNSNTAYVGGAGVSASTGYMLDPGETFEYERSTSNAGPAHQLAPPDIYVVGTAPDKIGWLAD